MHQNVKKVKSNICMVFKKKGLPFSRSICLFAGLSPNKAKLIEYIELINIVYMKAVMNKQYIHNEI